MPRSFTFQKALLLAAAFALHPGSSPAQQPPAGAPPGQLSRAIALTFDDLPMTVVGNDHIAGPLDETRYINSRMIGAMLAHHATALGLVNEVKLNVSGERDARTRILEDWLDAGMLLGNHGYSHRQYSDLNLDQYEAEFLRGDVITVPLLEAHHISDRYFRPPYIDSGDTLEKKQGFDRFLAAHGYRIAPFTIQNQDWMFNASYDEVRRRHDQAAMDRVRLAYLAHTTDEFKRAEDLASSSFHRLIPQIMFMHTDVLNADALEDVLRLMENRGYHFISLHEALRDPAYSTAEAFVGSAGPSWLDRWQPALNHAAAPAEPSPPVWIEQNYKRITDPGPATSAHPSTAPKK